eukprot:scaffold3272_cov59-Cylindrotheca_fusiformis.AAC.3
MATDGKPFPFAAYTMVARPYFQILADDEILEVALSVTSVGLFVAFFGMRHHLKTYCLLCDFKHPL